MKKSGLKSVGLLIFLGFCSWVVLADGWLGIQSDGSIAVMDGDAARTPIVTVERLNERGLLLSIAFFGVYAETRSTEQGPFVALDWPEAAVSGSVGQPQLPVLRRFIIVPPQAEFDVQIETRTQGLVDLSSLNLPTRVFPRQAPVPKIEGAREAAPFDYLPAAYSSGQIWLSETARMTEIGIWRGHRLCLLEVMPVSYDSDQGSLTLIGRMDVTIDFAGGGGIGANGLNLPDLGEMILNPPADTQSRVIGNYLIVVAQAYETEITPFETFKSGQGHTVTTHVVAPGTPAADIKTYIEGQYATPGTRPDYLLLVGDTDTIPNWTGGGAGSPNTDLQYACMDGAGDWYPDIPIGRFSVRSTAQLQAVIDKAIEFQTDFPNQGYLPNAVFMAGNDNYTITEGTHNYCIDTHMVPNEFVCDKVYEVTYGATTQDTRNSFNDGRYYGIFSGHGGTYSWADGPEFSQSDVENLDDDHMYSFICSFACVTGSYHVDECFTETWHRVADHGAVAIYGSSVNSYWDEDDILQRRLFDMIYDSHVGEVSPAWQAAMPALIIEYGDTSTVRRYYEMYNLLGDPSTPIPGLDLSLVPGFTQTFRGQKGGPFAPEFLNYRITNNSGTNLDYQASANESWLTVDNPSGNVPPMSSQTFPVRVNSNGGYLDFGTYDAEITVEIQSNPVITLTRSIQLVVGIPELVHQEPLNGDPGWSVEGDWAFGQPSGQGGSAQGGSGDPDPGSGFTGDFVYGFNLDGNYDNNMPEYHLTSTAFDCSTLTKVSLRFRRWLGVENDSWDHARLWVSPDQQNWTEIWANGGDSMSDGAWIFVEYDVSDVADLQPEVYFRWTMGTTDGSVIYCGWNIDDVEIWGLQMEEDTCPLDLNDDGVVNEDDFRQSCGMWCSPGTPCDVDGDGRVTVADYVLIRDSFGPCPE